MNTWRLSANGLRTVVELELKQRVRSRRWIWALVAWFALMLAVTSLVIVWVDAAHPYPDSRDAGPIAFSLIVIFVLGMGLVIAPAFSATAINGERNAGTLATLQATRLSALEIASGKLIAAWLAAAVFLVVTIPFIAWSMTFGRTSWWQVLVVFLVVMAEVAVVCAISLGFSALVSRPAGSTLLSYLVVVALCFLTLIFALLGIGTQTQTETVRVWAIPDSVQTEYQAKIDQYWNDHPDGGGTPPAPPLDQCTWTTREEPVQHTERMAWLLMLNPAAIISDAAPLPPGAGDNLEKYAESSADPLATISRGIRQFATPPASERDECVQLYYSAAYNVEVQADGTYKVTTATGQPVNYDSPVKAQIVRADQPFWPWALGVHVLLGAAAFWFAVRKLTIPYRKLTPGTRVA